MFNTDLSDLLVFNTVRITFRLNAGPHERFTESVARSLVGQRPMLNAREYEDGPITDDYGHCLIVGAEVVDDGFAVLVTYETDNVEVRRRMGHGQP